MYKNLISAKSLKSIMALCVFLTIVGNAKAQDNGTPNSETALADTATLMELSLEDLLNVPVVSASRKEESSFKSPLTSYVITSSEILKSGSTSIPDALRLCPGLIIRENTPGSYDVSIRGISQAPFQYQIQTNRTILVMIDYRSVYNNLDGGTMWSNLPIDLADVERIEVVEGPVASLYGPNAATGIINIITKKVTQKNTVRAITQSGLPGITNNSAYIGHQINEKLSISISGNYSTRQRTVTEFYDTGLKNGQAPNKYITDLDSLSVNNTIKYSNSVIKDMYPNPNQSMQKYGGNIVVGYKLNNTDITFRTGLSNGTEYKAAYTTTTTMIKQNLATYYGQLMAQNEKLTTYIDYTAGTYNYGVGINSFKFDTRTINAYIHYELKVIDNTAKLSVIPAISTQTSFNDGTPYQYYNSTTNLNFNFIDKSTINNIAPSLRVNFSPIEKLKFIGSIRMDKFTKNDKWLPNFALVANYLVNEKNIFRINYSTAYMGQFAQRIDASNISGSAPAGPGKTLYLKNTPQSNLQNASYQTLDLGYRSKIGSNLSLDISTFYNKSQNQSGGIPQRDTIQNSTTIYRQTQFQDLDLFIEQYGAQISVNISLFKNKIFLKPYVTYQTSTYYNYPVAYFAPTMTTNFAGQPIPYNTNNRVTMRDVMDPNWFGGLTLDYNITSKLSLNINSYAYAGYNVYTFMNRPSNAEISVVNGETSIVDFNGNGTNNPWTSRKEGSHVSAKIIFNAKLDYKITKNFSAFVNARNLTNNTTREFQFTDQIGGFYLVGLSCIY